MDFHEWSALVRVLMYAVIGPGLAWFAFDYWAAGNRWLSLLFALLSFEHFYVLGAVVLDIPFPDSNMITLDGLAPITVLMAVVLLRLVVGRVLARGMEWWIWRRVHSGVSGD